MLRKPLALLALFALLGLFLLRGGLTGLVLSQSCCMPSSEGCDAENACTAVVVQEPRAQESALTGILVFLLAVGLAAGELLMERRKAERLREERRNVRLRVA